MTDISAAAPPPDGGEGLTDGELPAEEVALDPELLALFESLRPLLTEFVKVGIAEAQESMVIPTARMGTVRLMDHETGTAEVEIDGDAATIPVTVVCEFPVPGDRVRVTFWGNGAAFVDGILGGQGVPPAMLCPYVGTIDGDGSSSTGLGPPRGYAWARGQVMSQRDCPGFYARCGTRFNSGGESSDQVRLPDMRGRVVLGLDNMGGSDAGRLSASNTLGGTGGAESVTLTTSNLPSHTHTETAHTHSFSASGTTGSGGSHSHNMNGTSVATWRGYGQDSPINGNAGDPGPNFTTSDGAHTHSFSASGTTGSGSGGSTGSTGSGSSVNILPPYMLVHWLVKL